MEEYIKNFKIENGSDLNDLCILELLFHFDEFNKLLKQTK